MSETPPVNGDPYARPTDPAKRRSAALTDGAERAGARAMLKGTGFTDEDLARPLVGVATTWIETMPCNLNQRELAAHVKAGIRAAGGTPLEFNTVAVSDGVSMGTEGMRASLVSREVITDSIELVARGHLFDGLVCLVGCDKTIPAAVMALARVDLPGLVVYNGSIAPGRFHGRDVTIQDVYEAIGAHAAGRMSAVDLHELEGLACPGAGACGGSVHGQHDGDRARVPGHQPRRPERHPGARARQAAGVPSRPGASRWSSFARMSGRPRSSRGKRSRTQSPPSRRREVRRTACSTCWPSRASSTSRYRSTTSTRSPGARRLSPASSPAGSSSPPTCTKPAG